MNYKKRIEGLKKRLRQEGLDGLFTQKKENISYLCGFDSDSSGLIITTGGRDFIITDSRFEEEASTFSADFNVWPASPSRHATIKKIAEKHRLKKFGFESHNLSYSDFVNIKKLLKRSDLIPTGPLVEALRAVKDETELRLIKESISIVKKAYFHLKKEIGPRMSGQRLAAIIDNHMRLHGASGPAFQTIVAQNPYSSHPHCRATKKAFGNNSAVVVDMGAVYKGYNSDLTRAIFLGRITTKFRYIYNILKASQEKAIKIIRPGRCISDLDIIARQHIDSKGFGKHFLHSLGHGVGLEIHESPRVSVKNRGRLRPGMVFTVEPGIYIPGWGGLRVEDMVAVTEKGYEVLTNDIPK